MMERAKASITLAHPEFQGQLTAAAKEMHFI
jgi:acyl-CoA hydrolase